MLVINRVELTSLDQRQQMWNFDRQHPARFQNQIQPGDKIVDVGYMREHVVGDEQVRGLPLRCKRAGKRGAEKTVDSRDPFALRNGGDICRGLNPQHGDAALPDELQQIAVIARHLDHVARRGQSESIDHCRDVAPRMFDPGIRKRREINVIPKNPLRGFELLKLDQPALFARVNA